MKLGVQRKYKKKSIDKRTTFYCRIEDADKRDTIYRWIQNGDIYGISFIY